MWNSVNLSESVFNCIKLSKSVWDCKNLGESEQILVRWGGSGWDWMNFNWNEWIWTNLSKSECVRCKAPSQTSETPPFPPISYPALAGLIGNGSYFNVRRPPRLIVPVGMDWQIDSLSLRSFTSAGGKGEHTMFGANVVATATAFLAVAASYGVLAVPLQGNHNSICRATVHWFWTELDRKAGQQ